MSTAGSQAGVTPLSLRKVLRNSLDHSKAWLTAWGGVAKYMFRGEADLSCWRAFLDLHCMTNGRSTDNLARAMRILAPPRAPQSVSSMLGSFDEKRLANIAADIERDGYYVFDQKIPGDICDEIAAAAMRVEAQTEIVRDGKPVKGIFNPDTPTAHRYSFAEEDIWQIPAFQRIIADPIFLNVAQAYLRTAPALQNVQLWWSSVMGGKSSSEAAQLFHFDYDPAPRWLKFFVHMTDVDVGSGPHIFVRGSHTAGNPKTKELFSRGYVRVSDDEIADIYGQENIIEFTGQRGTVLVVDTLGFHKGKAPTSNYRLIGQLVIATPLFVPSKSQPLPMPADATPALIKTRTEYPSAFSRYPLSA